MLAHVATPITAPRFSFDPKPARALAVASLTDLIWDLHSILVNPASKPGEAKSAKRRMLRALEETRRSPLLRMTVPSMAVLPESEEVESVSEERPDDSPECRTDESPVASVFTRHRTSFTKRERASSSRSFRANRAEITRGPVSGATAPGRVVLEIRSPATGTA
jgi:hypothetical protein